MRDYDVLRIRGRLGGLPHLPHLEMFTWQNVTLAGGLPGLEDRATRLGGSLHLSCTLGSRGYFFLWILMVRLFHIRYIENGPLEPGYPSCKRDEIKIRDYMGIRVTPPTWGPPPLAKQALNLLLFCQSLCRPRRCCLSSLLL